MLLLRKNLHKFCRSRILFLPFVFIGIHLFALEVRGSRTWENGWCLYPVLSVFLFCSRVFVFKDCSCRFSGRLPSVVVVNIESIGYCLPSPRSLGQNDWRTAGRAVAVSCGQQWVQTTLWSARQFLQSFVWAATAGESTAIPGRVARPTGQTCRVKWTTKKWKPIIFPSCFSNCRGLLTYHLETMLLAQTERELSPSCPLQLCLGDAIKC